MDDSSYVAALGSRQKLEREKGLETVRAILSARTTDDIFQLESNVLELVSNPENGWEKLHGGLCASSLMIEAGACSERFCKELQEVIPVMLDHTEPRVRLSAG